MFGLGGCCCGCSILETESSEYIARHEDIITDSMYTIRVGISPTVLTCTEFTSDATRFLLFYQGGGIYTRTGQPDGVEIEAKSYDSTYYVGAEGTEYYCPEYIHMTYGSNWLNYDYGPSVDLYTDYQTCTITSNCTDCSWALPTISSWASHRYCLEADLPSEIHVTVSGVTDSGDVTCLLNNDTWINPFTGSDIFDGYVMGATFGYSSSPDAANFTWVAKTVENCCLGTPLNVPFVDIYFSPGGGYGATYYPNCDNVKDALSSTWYTCDFDDMAFNYGGGFGCVHTGVSITIAEA